jgi:hypothetical protein
MEAEKRNHTAVVLPVGGENEQGRPSFHWSKSPRTRVARPENLEAITFNPIPIVDRISPVRGGLTSLLIMEAM